jgi:hypothetical protein
MEEIVPTQTLLGYNAAGLPLTKNSYWKPRVSYHGSGRDRLVTKRRLMIYESRYWKQPLLRAATWLERLRLGEANEERALARVERELFLGFYSIRKLLDPFKIAPRTRTMMFMLTWSPCVKEVDYMNAHRIDELFDLDVRHTEQRDLAFLCNQFIHSYVFAPVQHEDGALAGAYVASDRARNEKLYFVELDQILLAFRTVGRDYPASQHMRRNERTNQWEEIGTWRAEFDDV